MTIERDPMLESIFAAASKDLPGDDFAERVMSQVDSSRYRAILGWVVIGGTAVTFAFLLSGPLTQAVDLGMRVLPESLVELDDRMLARLLAPMNSIAGAVGLGFLGLKMAYSRLFSRR
ncbi:MAG: hypothetical protein ACR2QR_02335 [Woeseiaceae bacterium]